MQRFLTLLYYNFKPFDGVDSKLSRFAKSKLTQLQWRFESVPISDYFPHGVKTTYRAYSCDRVVEVEKRNKSVCTTQLGNSNLYCLYYSMISISIYIRDFDRFGAMYNIRQMVSNH